MIFRKIGSDCYKHDKMKQKGSLFVEAAAILPMFLVGLLTLASLLLMFEFRIRMQASLLYVAESLGKETADGHNVAVSDVRSRICEYMGTEESLYKYVLNGMEGIDCSASRLDNPEFIELSVSYTLIPFSDLFGLLCVPVYDSCIVHAWCGYERGYFSEDYGDYVYVADESEVYHLNRECSHIRLNISKTDGQNVKKLRNETGGKYHKCEICKPRLKDDVLYITSDGDRYHNSLSCPGLKRTVRSIRLKEAMDKGLRPCSRCGK